MIEWELIKPLIPTYGSPNYRAQEIVNAILMGRQWNQMRPHDLPSWSTVYDYYRCWTKTGVWESINRKLLKVIRKSEGRDEEPSLVIIDSQSVKTAEKRG